MVGHCAGASPSPTKVYKSVEAPSFLWSPPPRAGSCLFAFAGHGWANIFSAPTFPPPNETPVKLENTITTFALRWAGTPQLAVHENAIVCGPPLKRLRIETTPQLLTEYPQDTRNQPTTPPLLQCTDCLLTCQAINGLHHRKLEHLAMLLAIADASRVTKRRCTPRKGSYVVRSQTRIA